MALDPTGKLPGRGAYVDLDPAEVQKLGIKILDRVLETKLSDEFYQELLDYVTHQKPAKSCLAMENKTKILNLLGLAMRAGKLVTGEELTLKDIRANKAKFVFVAQDASENTRKKIKDKSSYYNVPVSELFSQFELSQAIGRPRMVIGVTDAGFATKIKELLKG